MTDDATVLLVPGLLSDGVVWRHVLSRLPAHVADLTTQSSLTEMAQACLDSVAGPLRLAGHSMGARVCLEMVRLAPERIERMALLDTGIHPLGPGERERREAIIRLAHDEGMAALAERWLPPMVAPRNRANAALMEDLREMVLRMDPDIHERQIRALVGRPDARPVLAGATCPVLLVVGSEDEWSPVAQHEQMLQLCPTARLSVVEGAGHFAPVEAPEEVTDLLVDFLTDRSGVEHSAPR